MALLGTWAITHAALTRRRAAACLSVLCAGALMNAVALKRDIVEKGALRQHSGVYAILGLDLTDLEPTVPIVVGDLHVYLPLIYYGSQALVDRLVYVPGQNPQADFQMARYSTWFPVQVMSWDSATQYSRLLVYDARDDVIVPGLLNAGWTIGAATQSHANPFQFPRPGVLVEARAPQGRVGDSCCPRRTDGLE